MMRQRLLILALLLGGWGLLGCQAPAAGPARGGDASDGRSPIEAIELWVQPAVVNWDDQPGPDGVMARVFFYRLDQPQSVPMTAGQLQFLLFEGQVPQSDMGQTQSFYTWTFQPAELVAAMGKGPPGPGYALALGWGKNVPRSKSVTLVARYLSLTGQAVPSAPVFLMMGVQ